MSLTAERAHELFEVRGTRVVCRSTGRPGYPAGKKGGAGQRFQLWADGKAYYEHRLAWLLAYGVFPPGQLDHVDGDTSNNTVSNLRLATTAENCQNIPRRGASRAVNGRWRARIMLDGASVSLGTFATEDEALAAYAAAKLRMHPTWASGRAAA